MEPKGGGKVKKLVAVCICILTLFSAGEVTRYFYQRDARVRNAAVTLSPSATYTDRDLQAAVNVVKRKFFWGWPGTLRSITYNEEKSSAAAALWAVRYGADEGVVLYSDFVADTKGRVETSGLMPGHVYSGWQWILVRSHGGRWKLKSWGYG